jgi:hypothetical protein
MYIYIIYYLLIICPLITKILAPPLALRVNILRDGLSAMINMICILDPDVM